MSRLTVFIDEAGDPGIRDGLRYLADRHEWLCISAVIVRDSNLDQVVDWVKLLRATAGSTQAGSLHYHRIRRDKRRDVCAALAGYTLGGVVVASHKSNMREYINPRIGQMVESGKFYNFCMRLLLERVTAWVERSQRAELGHLEPIKVIFAQRGHDWEHFFSYVDLLRMQKRNGTLFLKGPGLAEELLDRSSWSVEPAASNAGIQLADTVASAFYQAANAASPTFDTEPAAALRPIIATQNGVSAGFGVTLFPLSHQGQVPIPCRPIFKEYGYTF